MVDIFRRGDLVLRVYGRSQCRLLSLVYVFVYEQPLSVLRRSAENRDSHRASVLENI